ncbi:hypothetical protein Tco_0166829, partial [Tanacetum coccineum]
INSDNHQRKGIVSRNNYSRVDAKTTHPSIHRNMSPRAVLLKTRLTPLNTVRPVNNAHPKSAIHSAKSKPRAVNTARSFTRQVNTVRVKGGKPQQDDKGFVDSGCSRHMTGNIANLSNFKEFNVMLHLEEEHMMVESLVKEHLTLIILILKMYTLSMS